MKIQFESNQLFQLAIVADLRRLEGESGRQHVNFPPRRLEKEPARVPLLACPAVQIAERAPQMKNASWLVRQNGLR